MYHILIMSLQLNDLFKFAQDKNLSIIAEVINIPAMPCGSMILTSQNYQG